jgi:alpha-L-fucosidase
MFLKRAGIRVHYLRGAVPGWRQHVVFYAQTFKAEHYDPQSWAKLFKDAGALYVVPVFEHHDGFQMYDSGLSDWTAVKMGPKRDLIGDLAKAVRAEGLHLGASSHRIEHDWFMDVGPDF